MSNYSLELKFNLDSKRYKAVAFYPIHNNGCCDKNFFILTENKVQNPDGSTRINYSCQCACGMWCTNGHKNAQEAIDEYRAMCDRKCNEQSALSQDFYDYVTRNYLGKDSPEGDFAMDMRDDESFPRHTTYENLLSHLKRKRACREVLEIFESLYQEYIY